ncbi:MAG: RNA polymerase sigma factor [Candidatus Bipolaricaulis sp.]|nr:RNA polymerase sigma factor [Candidatus Bipolaricaulis sp.]MDD5219956.1 RNA polymerase sigma factor [Candidatus Bipolaricaulis sp.]
MARRGESVAGWAESDAGAAELEDRRLLARVARGDEDSLRVFYDRFAERVLRYAYTLLHRRHLAEDVVQETMVAVWNGAGRFGGRSKVSTWVFGIARHRALDLLRREIRGERVPDVPLTLPDPAPAVERREHVLSALSSLPEDQREVVFLTFYEGLSYKEIAAALAIPEGTVKSRMFHAKRKLAEALT